MMRQFPYRSAIRTVFDVPFYRTVFPLLVQTIFVAFPAIWAMRRSGVVRRFFCGAMLLLMATAGIAAAADAPAVRASIQPDADRKPAPEVVLKNNSGKLVKLKKYHGKVVLLDFWATWCTGCKMEIPWFAEFQKNYGRKGLAVNAISVPSRVTRRVAGSRCRVPATRSDVRGRCPRRLTARRRARSSSNAKGFVR